MATVLPRLSQLMDGAVLCCAVLLLCDAAIRQAIAKSLVAFYQKCQRPHSTTLCSILPIYPSPLPFTVELPDLTAVPSTIIRRRAAYDSLPHC